MKNIHIAIDGREANINSRVGSNVYAFEIISSLEKLLRKYDGVSSDLNIKVTVLLANKKITNLPNERKNWTYKSFGPQKFWTQWALPLHLFNHQDEYNLFFTPGHYAPRLSPIPYVSSVMDTAYITHPDQFKKSDTLKLTKWTKYSVKNAKKIVAISKYTKQAVVENYEKAPNDIVIAYPAIKPKKVKFSTKEKTAFFKKHKITEPYILFVGTLQPRKNIIKLIEAFEIFSRMKAGRGLKKNQKTAQTKQDGGKQVNQKQNRAKLVLAGKIGWLTNNILEKIEKSPLKNKIITTGFISEKEKQILYKNAFASCLVGLHEGFGIPPLESLNHYTLPIVSSTTSLPEVVGEAGLLTNPKDPKDIANKMWQALSMTTKEKGLFRKKARKQLKKFDWDKSAETILNALIEIANEKE
jgi:glycosyltransferase involved in cell wall biosynthesis